MKRHLFTLAAALACIPASAQTVLTVSTWVGPNHTLTLAQNEWCSLLEKNTSGKMKCNLLPKPVSAPPGTFDAVRDGLVDVSFTVDGYTPGRFVFTQLGEFPFLGDSAEATSVAYQRVYGKYFAPLGEHKGVKVISVFTHGPGVIFNTKQPVNAAADVAKLKVRVGGGNINELSKLMGWNTTLKPAPESYELLSTGVMDATFFPAESIKSFKLDMVKHATTFPGGLYNTSFTFMMNLDKYNKLSAEEKKAVDAISGEVAARIFGKGWDRVDAEGWAHMKNLGVQQVKASDAFINEIKAKQGALEDKWAAAAAAKGLKNPKGVLAEFRSEIQKAK